MEQAAIVPCVVAPLAGAILLVLLGGRAAVAVRFAAAAATLGAVCAAVGLVSSRGEPVRVALGGWAAPLGIALHLDGLSALLLATTAVIGSCITLYAHAYFRAEEEQERLSYYWPLWFIMWGALNALFLAGDIFNLYVTLELINLSAVVLVALPRKAAAVRAGLRYLVIAFLGSLSYLLGVAILYTSTGILDISMLAAQPAAGAAYALAACLILTGLMIKTALFPMHFWLPPAHSNAPAPVSSLLSGLVVTASAYIILRLGFTVFLPLLDTPLPFAVGVLGAAAVLWGSLHALLQPRVKMVIAYSTVAQLGYVFLVFPLAAAGPDIARLAWYGAFYFAVSHACAKAAAFLAAGALIQANGHDEVARLAGSAQRFPLVLFAFGAAGVNLVGLPPSGGFLAKWMLLRAAVDTGFWSIAAVLVAGSLLAAAYVCRVIDRSLVSSRETEPGRPLSRWLVWPALALALVPILLGGLSRFPLGLLHIGSPVGVLP